VVWIPRQALPAPRGVDFQQIAAGSNQGELLEIFAMDDQGRLWHAY